MKKLTYLTLFSIVILSTGCSQKNPKPHHHPKNPDYSIKKPKVVYKPSRNNLSKMVEELQGRPYVWAEEGPECFDCSGFTYYVYGSMGIDIPRVAREQAKVGKIITIEELQYGDLIFFNTTNQPGQSITHVGLYLGNGWFTHASTGKYEVLYTNLYTSIYFKERLRVCRRYLPDARTKVSKKKPWKIVKEQPIRTQALPEIGLAEIPPAAKEVPIMEEPVTKEAMKRDIVCATPASKENTAEGIFYIQVGSFEGKPKSDLLFAITRQGFTYKMIRFPKGNIQINKLLIGPYKSKKEVLAALPSVKQKIQKDAFVAEIR
ncbi:MAG: hypothetical protein QG564_426 [Campylobacterota bacterium]|nr:hypothetical protein [Campylobacterota bacterium]